MGGWKVLEGPCKQRLTCRGSMQMCKPLFFLRTMIRRLTQSEGSSTFLMMPCHFMRASSARCGSRMECGTWNASNATGVDPSSRHRLQVSFKHPRVQNSHGNSLMVLYSRYPWTCRHCALEIRPKRSQMSSPNRACLPFLATKKSVGLQISDS